MQAERTSRRRRGGSGLGRTQKLVLMLLAGEAKTVRHLSYDWPALTESAAQGAVTRLADRGLVDLAGFDYENRRTYTLTDKGRALELRMNVEGYEEDDR